MNRAGGRIKTVCFWALLGLIALGSVELALRGLWAVFPPVERLVDGPPPRIINDPCIEVRPSPHFFQHDRRGYRNREALRHADVVCLGDSQTYGLETPREAAFPQRLEALSGLAVYQIACGGWGPVHCLLLLDEAAALKPSLVIFGFYTGNDLFDSYHLVTAARDCPKEEEETLALLRNADRDVIRSCEELDRVQTIRERWREIFQPVLRKESNVGGDRSVSSARRIVDPHLYLLKLSQSLRENIYLRTRTYSDDSESDWEHMMRKAWTPPAYEPFERGVFRTVFMPAVRLLALNRHDLRIQEGLRLSLRALHVMERKLSARGIHLLVLIIPTKEFVFADVVRESGVEPTADYRELIREERRLREIVQDRLIEMDIDFVDAAPALKECLTAGRQPYPVTNDGHPNSRGHAAIAGLLCEKIEALSERPPRRR